MGKIVILDEGTANKIAAGEVVERPASVVKELVENSIDAGAGSVSIEIKNGGVSFIKVTDNGSGMDEDDVEIAFERHSTSKIKSADDLETISTMGFRGEALASIAAVSKVELTTRVERKPHGTLIRVQGGVINEVRQTGCPVGTTFIIKDLFYNTPARFKFLKKDTTEAGYVSDVVSRIALGNPQISFRMTSNNVQLLHTPGNNDLLSTIYSIYGKETAKELKEIKYQDNRVKIMGYAGKPEIARANRNHQSIYINGRYIKSKLIASAIDEAYKTMLMKNKFAFIVLNMEINPLLVDVNVHPTKMEVRFSEEQEIFRSVYHSVNNALLRKTVYIEKDENILKPNEGFKFTKSEPARPQYTQQTLDSRKFFVKENQGNVKPEPILSKPAYKDDRTFAKDEFKPASTIQLTYDKKAETGNVPSGLEKVPEESELAANKQSSNSELRNDLILEQKKPEISYKPEIIKNNIEDSIVRKDDLKIEAVTVMEEPAEKEISRDLSILENSRIIGQVFSTYILLQHGEEMIMVDQHAAHERIMYEKLKKRYADNEPISQSLIAPLVIKLTHSEIKVLEEKIEFFKRIGYDYENFGNNSIILRAVPHIGDGESIKAMFLDLLDTVTNSEKSNIEAVENEALYTIACKAAIKANKKLDELEIRGLLDELAELENPFTCPHGRPTTVTITKYEIEKKFKRIV